MIPVEIKAFGNWCNHAPYLEIFDRTRLAWHGTVVGHTVIEFDVDLPTTISIRGIHKQQGEHGVWDTYVDGDAHIMNDLYVRIDDISIDGISMGQDWLQHLRIKYLDGQQACFSGSYFGDNACIGFDIATPLLTWIIQQKFMQDINSDEASNTRKRSGQEKFDYQPLRARIAQIRRLIDAQDTDIHPAA